MVDNPSEKRESALSEMLQRLGASKSKEERYNNGYAHFSLAVHSAYARAFETRMATFVSKTNLTITGAKPIKEEDKEKAKDLIGKNITVERSIFDNTMTLTTWTENFYQESPSINARARDDQVQIGSKGFAVPVITPHTVSMEEED